MECLAMAKPVAVLDTIELLYRAAVEPALWPDALQRLALACGGMGTAMIPITPGDITGLIVSTDLMEANVEYENRGWWRHDSRVLRIHSRNLSDGVCCEPDLFTDAELARDMLRNEFCPRYGVGSFAAHLVAPMPGQVIAFSVQRSNKRGHFEGHELETLDLLGRHAARALIVSSRLQVAAQMERTLVESLARFDCGMLVIDRSLKVILANGAATELMADGLCVVDGKLSASSGEVRAVLDRLMRSVLSRNASADSLAPAALRRPSGRQPLIVQAIPIARAVARETFPAGAAALVIVIDPTRKRRPAPVDAFRLLGLTPSQARLAALIGEGYSRAEAADALGLSQATVSDTIKHIYAKLEISRQSHLVRLASRLAAFRT
jgi:DNA-binding CsgD family transcriptional regulator